jgi:hypothetical protein
MAMPTIILHIQNEDPVLGEVDELPSMADSMILVRNPRMRDGKELHYLNTEVNEVIWNLARVTFIEVMGGDSDDEIISFVRE